MWGLLGALLVLGLSANEPSALLVVLVVTRSGRSRGAAFVAGWIVALLVVTVGAGFVARFGLGPRPGGPRRVTLIIELVIGIALILGGGWYWWHHRNREPTSDVPKILTRLTSIGLLAAFATGLATATYPPAIVAGTTLLRSRAGPVVRVAGLAVFVVIGTIMVATPVVATYVAPDWTSRRSDSVFDWTLRHRRVMLTTILVVVGIFIAARASIFLDRGMRQRP